MVIYIPLSLRCRTANAPSFRCGSGAGVESLSLVQQNRVNPVLLPHSFVKLYRLDEFFFIKIPFRKHTPSVPRNIKHDYLPIGSYLCCGLFVGTILHGLNPGQTEPWVIETRPGHSMSGLALDLEVQR